MKDQRVQVAIDNWAPRFVANGVDMNDFYRITADIERWDDWCSVWSQWGADHTRLGDEAEAAGFYRSAGQHFFEAAMLYHFGKFMFFHRADEHRRAHDRVVSLYQRGMPYFDHPGERFLLPYEGGAAIPAILRKPWGRPKPPLVVLVPGLDSVKEEMHNYGNDFLARGLAVLAIDGPGQGEMEFEHPMRHDYEVVLRHVLDWVEQRADVDAGRVGVMGVSVGGYYAVRGAALEPRIRAAIVLATGYRLADYFDRVPILTREAFTHRLHAGTQEAARAMLEKFDLHGVIEGIQTPLLIVMGRRDRLFPAEASEEMAAAAGARARLLMFDDGNHVCNNIPYKYRPQQADWMTTQLGAC